MTSIDWARLARAMAYYERSLDAQSIDVPWWVTQDIISVTCPPDRQAYGLDLNGKKLVGSAEQSFLYMLAKGQLAANVVYQAITPCFREEPHTRFHRKHFMKLELFSHGDVASLQPRLDAVLQACQAFFSEELPGVAIKVVPEMHHASLPGSVDLVADVAGIDHELGSYGMRTYDGLGTWLYATGCAEPRTSSIAPTASRSRAGGYHLSEIQRGTFGQLSKVLEEYHEALDAEAQGVDLMVLQELSDLVGAAGAVAERYGSSLDALVKMAAVTRRAFQAGHRRDR
jgi:hypothetical protein